MDETILREAGHRLYITSRLKEMKRYLVFRARCRMHKEIIEDFIKGSWKLIRLMAVFFFKNLNNNTNTIIPKRPDPPR